MKTIEQNWVSSFYSIFLVKIGSVERLLGARSGHQKVPLDLSPLEPTLFTFG